MSFIFALIFIALGIGLLLWLIGGKSKQTTVEKVPAEADQVVNFPKNSLLIVAVVLLAYHTILYSLFSHYETTAPVAGFALFNLVFLGVMTYLLRAKIKTNRYLWLPIVISASIGCLMILRANGFVQGVNLFSIKVIALFLLAVYSFDTLQPQGIWLLKKMLSLFPRWLFQVFKLFDRSSSSDQQNALKLAAALKTTVITGIVLCIFTLLLMNADPIFAEKVSSILEQAYSRVITSVVVVGITASLISLQVLIKKKDNEQMKSLAVHDLVVPMVAVALLFGFFITIQIQYLFAGKTNLGTFNITYSEYVRKGFIELLMTTFLGGILVYAAAVKSHFSSKTGQFSWLKTSAGVLVIELFFLLASALKRDLMYVDVYGLTRVRVIGGVFIVWLAAVLFALLALLFIKRFVERKFLYFLVTISAVVVVLLNVVNIDAFVATAKPSHHTYTDYFYSMNLSEDAATTWQAAIDSISADTESLLTKETLTDVEKSQLAGLKLSLISFQEKRLNLLHQYMPETELLQNAETYGLKPIGKELPEYIQEKKKWQLYNASQMQAYKQIVNNKELYITKVDSLVEKIGNYQREKNISLFDQEHRLLYEFSYPFISINLAYYPEDIQVARGINPSPSPSVAPTFVPTPNFSLDDLLNDTCKLKPTMAFTTQVYVTKVEENPEWRNYYISETANRNSQPMALVKLAEDISTARFDEGLPGYKTVTLKNALECDIPIIVYAQ